MADENRRPYFACAATVVSCILFSLFCVFLASFSYLDFYSYGFKRQKSTARVFTDAVYTGGRYFLGPDFEFQIYPASTNNVALEHVTVFTNDALEVYLDVEFEYFIRPEQLNVLHQKYQLTYDSVIRNSAVDALKVAAVDYTTEQFIKDRNSLEKAMEKAVRLRISGKCCEADCQNDICLPDCIPFENCTQEEDMGLMVNMRYFYLTEVDIPYKVYNRYLKALLLVEVALRAEYRLKETVIEKQVEEEVKDIKNQVNEVLQNATAQASLIKRKANAEAKKQLGRARSEGLQIMLTNSGFTNKEEKEKMSLYYLRTLRDNEQAHLAVDFNNYVISGDSSSKRKSSNRYCRYC